MRVTAIGDDYIFNGNVVRMVVRMLARYARGPGFEFPFGGMFFSS